MTQYQFSSGRNPWIAFIVGILIFAALFYLMKGIFWVLTWVSPVLLIITLIMNHNVVLDYFKWLWHLLTTTPFFGILSCGLSFFGAPVVIFYLFGKMLMLRQSQKIQQQFEQRFNEFNQQQQRYTNQSNDDGFADYEDVTGK